MKSNQKFRKEDEGVSAVIGVILMVAITVAIAATVYVYVSGMLSGTQNKAPNMALNKETTPRKEILLVSADTGLNWADFTIAYTGLTNPKLNGAGSVIATGGVIGSTAIKAGDYINVTGTGSLSITNTPTNTLMGSWTWS